MNIRRKLKVGWRFRLVGLLFGWGVATMHSAPLRIVGSDLLGENFKQAVEQFAEERGMGIEVEMRGSWQGRRALEGGRAEVALISLAPGDPEFDERYSVKPLAYHIAVLQVRRELALERLSYSQLREIFGNEETGARKRWRDYGAQGPENMRMAMAGRIEGDMGLAKALFDYELNLASDRNADSNGEKEAYGEDVDRILISPQPPSARGDWVAVSISREPHAQAFLPTGPDVHRGDYPLRWPLLLVFRSKEVELLYPLLRFLLSEEVAKQLEMSQLVPVPESIRRERIFELERL